MSKNKIFKSKRAIRAYRRTNYHAVNSCSKSIRPIDELEETFVELEENEQAAQALKAAQDTSKGFISLRN